MTTANLSNSKKLPSGEELLAELSAPGPDGRKQTYESVGSRYGASRQAVWKRIKKFQKERAKRESES